MISVTKWVSAALIGIILGVTMARAEENKPISAYEVVRQTTEHVLQVVQGAEDYIDEKPEHYFDQLQLVLDPVIDYRGFARGVMGEYATSSRYKSLDEAGRAQLRAQLDRFTSIVRDTLINTYGKGLLAFGGSRIEVEEPPEVDKSMRVVSVRQQIYNDGPKPYQVNYQMGRDKSGTWKLRNVIIESVNLGQIYRNQFQAAARKHNGDLDQVIDNWDTPAG